MTAFFFFLLLVVQALLSLASPYAPACHAVDERCLGAPGRPFVPHGTACCAPNSSCTEPADDYGMRCSEPPPQPPPPLGFLVIVGRDYDRKGIRAYIRALPPIYEKFGGEYIASTFQPDVLEGGKSVRLVIISKWPSVDAGKAFWDSPEYGKAKLLREGLGDFDIMLLPALPGVGVSL